MIAVELAFEEGTPERSAARPAHRDRLAHLHTEGRLHAAGPWDDDSGALLLFTGDESDVDEILSEDPYYSTPGVRIVTIRTWRLLVGPGEP